MDFKQERTQQQTFSQKQKLTPQLLQGIQLLQLNREKLLSYLNQKALENPLIEVRTAEFEENFTTASNASSKQQDLAWVPDTELSLIEFLTEQVLVTYRDTYLREMVFWWINQLDENGYVTKTVEEAADETGAEYIQMLDALTLVHQLEPAGVGARNLQECLMLQTERLDDAPNIAYIVLEESFDDFVNRKWDVLAKRYDVSLSEVQNVFDFVHRLTASPAAPFQWQDNSTILPELIVSSTNDTLEVKEAKYGSPLLSFKADYANQLTEYDDKEVNRYVKEKKKEYDALQKHLTLRGQTILRVGTAIIERQKQFFLDKTAPLAPLQLNELAEELDLHVSTISRAVQDTYVQTDNGSYELKSFLSRKQTANGEQSTDSAKQALQKIVDSEDKKRPLSDQKIVAELKEKGLDLSRRTVAKYRTQLNIPSSSKRKRFD